MTRQADRQISTMEAQIALPRENGELIFQAPWEARAFGLAVALNQQDLYKWREFSAELAVTIAAAEQNNDPSSYYTRWVASLEELIIARGLISREQLDAKTAECAAGIHDDHDH
ncbi:MAG: nitrile hydratase accessory protein [Candidatus Latescibacteria bacterium]|nr:nitrile hydratase accessory protein [Candidatus Latescibacterota bacterium]